MSQRGLNADPKILGAMLETTLHNRKLDPTLEARLQAGSVFKQGSLLEILDLSKSLGLEQFVKENGLAEIENNAQLQAKLTELVSLATSMTPQEAFVFVKKWLQFGERASSVKILVDSYMSIATTIDRHELKKITADTLSDSDLTHHLAMTVTYDQEIKLVRGDDHSIDQDLEALRKVTGRKAEVVQAIDFKGAYLVSLLANLLAEATKQHIGADILNGTPVVCKDVDSFADAERFSRPLPTDLKRWQKGKLHRSHLMSDYDHLAFLENPEKMRNIVNIVLPDGEKNPQYIAYASALKLLEQPNVSPDQIKQSVLLALRNLQERLYKHICNAFAACHHPIHPEMELAARNLAWYALTTGEGAKVSPYWAQIHPLNERRHIDQSARVSLASSIATLEEIAAAEGVELTNEKRQIAEKLTADLRSTNFSRDHIVEKIQTAFQVMKRKENPISTASTNVENWYITNVLFRVLPDPRGTKATKDGKPRTDRSVMELLQFIRTFGMN